MITKVYGPKEFARRVRHSPQYVRAVAEAGIVDAFVSETDRMFYPMHALSQWRDYEQVQKKKEKEKDAHEHRGSVTEAAGA